jgi:hypothetical protein
MYYAAECKETAQVLLGPLLESDMSVNPATAVAVTQIVKAFRVSWTNSTTAGATHTVYRSRGANGAFVAVATGAATPYIDYDVANGETYSYQIIASVGTASSVLNTTITRMYNGPVDQYVATLTSSDALTDRRGAVAVYTNYAGIPQGCGEFQRLQRLRGQATMCGK